MIKPLSDTEWRELMSATMHGSLPWETVRRVLATVDRVMTERDGLKDHASDLDKMLNERTDQRNQHRDELRELEKRAVAGEELADRLMERQCPIDEFLPGDEPCDALTEARKFGEEAAAKHNELLVSQRVLRCAFCDAEYTEGTPATQHERLTEHVKVCPDHPMREVEERLTTAIRWLRRIEVEHPGSINEDAIDKHLEGKAEL